MNPLTRIKLLVLVFPLQLIPSYSSALELDQLDYWQILNVSLIEEKEYSSQTRLQLRSPDMSYVGLYRVSQQFFYKTSKDLTLGLHPVYSYYRTARYKDWESALRLDLEATYKFKLKKLKMKLRGRYEIREHVDKYTASNRFRLKAVASYPAKFLPGLKYISMANELFIDAEDGKILKNKFIPLRLTFEIKKTYWSPWIMYQVKRYNSSADWKEGYVIGCHGNIQF